jgi:lipase chaperone LimK
MKRTIAIAIALTFLAVLLYRLTCSREGSREPQGYVIDKGANVSREDVMRYFKTVRIDSTETAGRYFSESVANAQTVRFFKSLQWKFREMNLEDHLKAVHDYLLTIMDPARAEEMFALYRKFTGFEQGLGAAVRKWKQPGTVDEALAYLRNLQDYRRDFFGKELADALWGAEVKIQEYRFRKGQILQDTALTGSQKERKLASLKGDMWGSEGDEAPDGFQKPFDRYTEKLQMYSKDLDGMPEADKSVKIREFRREYFSDEVVKRLEGVDAELAAEKQKEDDYRKQEFRIQSDVNLTADEKEKKILDLQNETFGDEADAFRRRENIMKASK